MGTAQTEFGFTGEVTDANEQLYLRARYYAPLTGTFTALDPWEGTPARPMSLNGYSWVEGNTPNVTDPSGMCAENPLPVPILNPTSSHQLPQGTNNYGWSCAPRGCQQWLQDAYNQLNGRSPLLDSVATLLDDLGKSRSGWKVHFQFFTGGGAITPYAYYIGMPNSYLGTSPNAQQIGLLAHELWHVPQGNGQRYSTWGEVEAYNFETAVLQELGQSIPQWRQSLLQYGNAGSVSRSVCDMCQARECLLSVFGDHPMCFNEPVLVDGLLGIYWPYYCGSTCPNIVSRTCV